MANIVNDMEVQKAVHIVCSHEQKCCLCALRSMHGSVRVQSESEIVALACELVNLVEPRTVYPGEFHDGGLVTVDQYKRTCCVIHEPSFLALVEFLRMLGPKWEPIDLKVSAFTHSLLQWQHLSQLTVALLVWHVSF